MTKEKLEQLKEEYAKLIIYRGLNNLKGQILLIRADFDQPEFVLKLIKYAYKRGARRVLIDWTYREERKLFYKNISKEEANKVYEYEYSKTKFCEEENVRTIRLQSTDPFWSESSNQETIAIHTNALLKNRYRPSKQKVETPWVICNIPGKDWAKRLFPKLSVEKAIDKLWELIFLCCRVELNKSIKNWEEYNKFTYDRYNYLNSLHIKELHYKSSNGTDLIVGINPHAKYTGGAHAYPGKNNFNPNLPANECFTSPDKYNVNGILYSTKPLCRNGIVMEDFYFVFKKGKIIEVHAKKNEKYLKELVNTDKGSCYLGEASLVPFDSFINQTGITFYYTVYDENACCHFALGYSLENTYKDDVKKLSDKEKDKLGLNQSSIHVDFMIGSKDLSIIATTYDNKKITIFKNGVYAK